MNITDKIKNVWFMIPARAGSKTIPRKNVRHLGGTPLIEHVIRTIRKTTDSQNIIVSTDDDDIKPIAENYGVLVHNRSGQNANDKATLDDVALEVAEYLLSNENANEADLFMTVQPTSPFLSEYTIRRAVDLQNKNGFDTVLTVKDDRHLRWTEKDGDFVPLFSKRVNRQQMDPVYAETGGIISARIGFIIKNMTRIGENISVLEVDEKEGLDIDNYSDWALAEYWMNKLRIYLRVDGGKHLGMGHLYRALAIAQNIHSHDVTFVTRADDEFEVGKTFLEGHHYPILTVRDNNDFINLVKKDRPDIVVNDILDTEAPYILKLKDEGSFVINFEDLGEGNRHADIIINDLYPDLHPQSNHWYGVEHAILNPNFESVSSKNEPTDNVENILLAYGGSDPGSLTLKALEALKLIGYDGSVDVVIGPANSDKKAIYEFVNEYFDGNNVYENVSNMAVLMKKADLALTSAGRTVTELMIIGVPTIAMCQNLREMRHNHASSTYGIINLGMGKSISHEVLGEHIGMFLRDTELRIDMYKRMKAAVKKRSNKDIVAKILSTYKSKV